LGTPLNKFKDSNKLTKSIRKGKEALRHGGATVRYNAYQTLIGRPINKVRRTVRAPFTKLYNKMPSRFQKGFQMAGKIFGKAGRFAGAVVKAPFKVLGFLTNLIHKIISTIGLILLVIIAVDIVFIILIEAVSILNPFAPDDSGTIVDTNIDVGWLVETLDEQHEELIKKVKNIEFSENYDDFVVVFNPSSGQENYKEIICASAVMMNNDFGNKKDVKKNLKELYDSGHSLSQSISTYERIYINSEGEEETEYLTRCTVTINIADNDTLLLTFGSDNTFPEKIDEDKEWFDVFCNQSEEMWNDTEEYSYKNYKNGQFTQSEFY
jgi:hypothetical protein